VPHSRPGDGFALYPGDLYSFNPKISNVSAEFAAADPQFWGLKPVMAKPGAGARASGKK